MLTIYNKKGDQLQIIPRMFSSCLCSRETHRIHDINLKQDEASE